MLAHPYGKMGMGSMLSLGTCPLALPSVVETLLGRARYSTYETDTVHGSVPLSRSFGGFATSHIPSRRSS